jgi:Flp pilus assembly protein TadG
MFSGWLLRKFRGDARGNVAITFGLLAPVLLMSVGSAVDYSLGSSQKTTLQNAADAGALAGAKELTLGGVNGAYAADIAKLVARNNVTQPDVSVSASMTPDKSGIEVNISQRTNSFFSNLLPGGPTDIQVRSVATSASAAQKVCVLGLDEDDNGTIRLDSSAKITANECAVFSNSKNKNGLRSETNALLSAQLICSAGGKVGGPSNYAPTPMTDCPVIKDPLASRPAPTVGACNYLGWVIKDVVRTLGPGTFCGGLRIDGNAKVKLLPGIYVIKDGPLIVDSNAQLEGDYVGFYFTGKNAFFRFTSNARVTLGAPKDGVMAGILFFSDRASDETTKFEITSNFTRKLLGTIYFPNNRFSIDANQPVADQSAYTAIVVRKLELTAAPNLVINSSYDATDVPVPNGIGPATGKTRLIQ